MKKIVSDETRARLSVALKGKPKSIEHRANMKKPKSTEHRAKIAAALKGRSPSEESIEKCIETYRRKKLSKLTSDL